MSFNTQKPEDRLKSVKSSSVSWQSPKNRRFRCLEIVLFAPELRDHPQQELAVPLGRGVSQII